MSLVIIGSLAFDTIETPFGRRERIVGGSGTYCSLAASFFTQPKVVGVVGEDFPEKKIMRIFFGMDAYILWSTEMANTLFVLAIVFAGLFVIFSILIVNEVSKRGIKINFFLLRLYIIKYIHQYRKITKEETGKIGPLYYPCIISVNLALVCAIIGIVLK